MQFNVHAVLSNGYTVFRGNLSYLPRIGEEFEIGSYLYKVKNVTYILSEGRSSGVNVRLLLKLVNDDLKG